MWRAYRPKETITGLVFLWRGLHCCTRGAISEMLDEACIIKIIGNYFARVPITNLFIHIEMGNTVSNASHFE